MLPRHAVVLLGSHGALVTGRRIVEACDRMCHPERACRMPVRAYATGQKLRMHPMRSRRASGE